MVLESTVICVDNSEWMRNGDFLPTRIQAQQDAVGVICHAKTRQNPENNVALLTLASLEVLATLTTDVGRILTKLHQVQPTGFIKLITGIRIAHLALKHRQGKNHRLRIVSFVGSPINDTEKELTKLAKKLKKEKVNVDVVCMGEDNETNEKLSAFINTLNGKEGTSCHLVTVPPGPALADALRSSPVVQGEDGYTAPSGFGSGFDDIDPNLDPELALALRVSMEEQRQRQEEEAKETTEASKESKPQTAVVADSAYDEDAVLRSALNMSMAGGSIPMDLAALSEEEQIAMAIQMSMQDSEMEDSDASRPTTAATDNTEASPLPMDAEQTEQTDDNLSSVMTDPEFLQHLVSSLPGVNPDSEAVRSALGSMSQQSNDKKDDKKKDDEKAKK
ncbi:26S proteasome non-ATPase regulatory subunit 4-like [Rhopilema esculentum]|uniref:26S proteasome non-ATPase regulatory subunit 4-like n=1 Tax=Rhopilema esculentum TaxID=499914 RepID=UPI0031DDE737|eukprot:gene12422-3086_t